MRCLVTGSEGFIGTHLLRFLLGLGLRVSALTRGTGSRLCELASRVTLIQCDITDKDGLHRAISSEAPDVVFHLAAQSLPTVSWRDPEATFRVNVLGTQFLLDAIRAKAPSAKTLVVGSSAEYGSRPDGRPLSEEDQLVPSSPYALSKIAASHLSALYARVHGLSLTRVRPFSVIGPGKFGDAVSDIARGIAAIERGEERLLPIGNTAAVRDFVDVRDAVRAFSLVAQTGTSGEVYNVSSGQGTTIGAVLEQLIALSPQHITVWRDPARDRPLDEPIKVGDNSRLGRLGWSPTIPLPTTLTATLDYWRNRQS
jgi:GDP-4-dehydro-6-deoxy-D-mannose reductase